MRMTDNEAVERLIAQQEKCNHCRAFNSNTILCYSSLSQTHFDGHGTPCAWYDAFICGDAHNFWFDKGRLNGMSMASAQLTCLGYCRGEPHE